MRFAYADPPYFGRCSYYCHEHNDAGSRPFDGHCWNDLETHRSLIDWLVAEFPDGWAMSATSTCLRDILPMTPRDVRIGAWVKTFCAFKKNVRPAYAWEPVLFRSSANPPMRSHAPPERDGKQNTPKDFIAERITLQRGLTGSKPARVCDWILDLLNVGPSDEVVDLFPGAGPMTTALTARRAA